MFGSLIFVFPWALFLLFILSYFDVFISLCLIISYHIISYHTIPCRIILYCIVLNHLFLREGKQGGQRGPAHRGSVGIWIYLLMPASHASVFFLWYICIRNFNAWDTFAMCWVALYVLLPSSQPQLCVSHVLTTTNQVGALFPNTWGTLAFGEWFHCSCFRLTGENFLLWSPEHAYLQKERDSTKRVGDLHGGPRGKTWPHPILHFPLALIPACSASLTNALPHTVTSQDLQWLCFDVLAWGRSDPSLQVELSMQQHATHFHWLLHSKLKPKFFLRDPPVSLMAVTSMPQTSVQASFLPCPSPCSWLLFLSSWMCPNSSWQFLLPSKTQSLSPLNTSSREPY